MHPDTGDIGDITTPRLEIGFIAIKCPAHCNGLTVVTIAISANDVGNDSVITLEVVGSGRNNIDFSVTESIRLRETPGGLHLETVNVRNTPIDGALFFELH